MLRAEGKEQRGCGKGDGWGGGINPLARRVRGGTILLKDPECLLRKSAVATSRGELTGSFLLHNQVESRIQTRD